MAGLTEQGLTVKRQNEVINDLKQQVQPIFQDLVPPDDVVDTSDSSTIGRLVGLLSLPIADLWEAVQQVYLAFDPNSATGIALDNLVMYGGLTRNPASATTSVITVWGDEGTTVLSGSTVRALDNTLYDLTITTGLVRDNNIGFRLGLSSVVSGTTYGLTITSGNTSVNATTVAGGSSTPMTVLSALSAQLASQEFISTSVDNNTLLVESTNIFDYIGVTPTNLTVAKIKSRTEVKNQVLGYKDQEANTITSIATPILGWDSVNNPSPATPGRDAETDEELRLRFRDSKFVRGQNISDALYSALLAIDGVRYAAIYENETDVYDAVYDLAPHSFKPVVLGGNPQEIATAVWNNKPLGIASEGNTTEIMFDSQGFQRDIHFERPNSVPIYITLDLSTDSDFPATGVDQIKSALVSYFQEHFSIGEDVIYSRLYTPINSVGGHQVDSMTIGKTASPSGTSNIVILYNEIASLNTDNIIVNV